ncbi:MAG TPA: hypothetical protein HPP87_09060 [Planctomycetes bacterium]|nr:hypothetical protein [Planctomycetota bacterium]
MKSGQKRTGSRLGFIAGIAAALSGKSRKPTGVKKADFKTSSQRIGVRFTDKIRDVFRRRWLKKS